MTPRRIEVGAARRIVIDGPSGSGKTTLANQLSQQTGFRVLHLDDWYPDWDGLAEGTRIAEDLVTGRLTSYPRWDWDQHRIRDWVPVELGDSWILEGCGALTEVTRAAADLAVWVEASPEVARRRGLERDGDGYAPWWDRWHRQELEHWSRHRPRNLADLRVSTD